MNNNLHHILFVTFLIQNLENIANSRLTKKYFVIEKSLLLGLHGDDTTRLVEQVDYFPSFRGGLVLGRTSRKFPIAVSDCGTG